MQESFDTLKELIFPPVLAYPGFSEPFSVTTDASCTAVRAILSDLSENGRENQIYYVSKKFEQSRKVLFDVRRRRAINCVRIEEVSTLRPVPEVQAVHRS